MIYLIIAFNFVSFITYKKAHIDFDSASHLFKAINYKSYKSGYKIGIKLPILLFYKLLLTKITKNKYFFRILNFLIINILTFIFLLKSERTIQNNLIILNKKIKKIAQIENIFVTEFNKDYAILKIKHLGKLEKITNQLKNQNINLQLIDDQWIIKLM